MRVVFFGTPDFVLPVGKILAEKFELVGVVTLPDSPEGRKKIMTPTPVKNWYMDYLLKENKEGMILTPAELTDEIAVKLRKLHPDLFVVAAYGKLVPDSILNLPTLGAINIHPSLLPKYRGPAPIQNALLNGDKNLGITIMQMDQDLDHGPLLSQWEIPISSTDTFQSLHQKAFTNAAEKLPEIIEKYESGKITPTPQDHNAATFTEKILRTDGFFSLEEPPGAKKLDSMIRAYFPWPSAWTKVKIKNQELRLKFLPEKKVQIEGGKVTTIKDFLNGYPELKQQFEKLTQEM